MTDASERERLIDYLEVWHSTSASAAADMLRADAETIQQKDDSIAARDDTIQRQQEKLAADAETIRQRDAAIFHAAQMIESYKAIETELRTQLAAQSAELERVRNQIRIIHAAWHGEVAVGPRIDAAFESLAAPSAAGGEKEG